MSYSAKKVVVEGERILVSTGKLCDIMSISQRTLANWGTAGCPKGERRGWYDLQEVLEWRGLTGKKLGHGDTSVGQDDGLMRQKLAADVRYKQMQSETMQFRHDLESGRYIERDALVSDLTRLFAEIRRVLLSLPRRVTTMLGSSLDSDTIKGIEQDIITSVTRAMEGMSVGDFCDGEETNRGKRRG